MKVECICGKEDIGNYKKLIKRGWWIYFINNNQKVIRCKKCKPKRIDKFKIWLNKDYIHEAHKEIFKILKKIKILRSLTSREELNEEAFKRVRKRRLNYNYKRNKGRLIKGLIKGKVKS